MKEYPLLTICVLTYNCEKFIGKTLASLLSQTYPNFEILISDNGSSDKTLEIVKTFSERNSSGKKINIRHNIPKIIPGTIHEPYCDNVNGCLKSGLIAGNIVAFCHHHDIYYKDFAKKEAEFLINNPEAGAVFGSANVINTQGEKTGELRPPKELRGKNIYNFDEIFMALMIGGNNFLATPTFMARKKIFEDVGLFDERRFSSSRDLDLWLKILEKYYIGVLSDVVVDWKNEGGKAAYQYLCTQRADFFNVMDYYLKKFPKFQFDKKCMRRYNCQKRFDDTLIAINFLIKGESDKAKNMLKKTTFDDFVAFFEKISVRKIKGELIRFILILGIKLGLEKHLKNILYKLRYSR